MMLRPRRATDQGRGWIGGGGYGGLPGPARTLSPDARQAENAVRTATRYETLSEGSKELLGLGVLDAGGFDNEKRQVRREG